MYTCAAVFDFCNFYCAWPMRSLAVLLCVQIIIKMFVKVFHTRLLLQTLDLATWKAYNMSRWLCHVILQKNNKIKILKLQNVI